MKAKWQIRVLLLTSLVAALVFALALPALAADTGWQNPTANAPGPSNWGFNTPTGAYTDGMGPDGWSYTEAMQGTLSGKPFNVHEFYGYDFSAVPDGATINGIKVRMDAWLREGISPEAGSIAIELSWDNGATWTTAGYSTGALNQGETTYYAGSASDTWGNHTWTSGEIKNAFRVRLTSTLSGDTNGRVRLDWVPVIVYCTPGEPTLPVPEISAGILLALALVGLGAFIVIRRKKNAATRPGN